MEAANGGFQVTLNYLYSYAFLWPVGGTVEFTETVSTGAKFIKYSRNTMIIISHVIKTNHGRPWLVALKGFVMRVNVF